MISIIRIFFISLLLLLPGCVKNQFTLEFELAGNVSANYKISYYASDKRGGMMIESVAAVANGKAVFKGATVNPTLVYLSGPSKQPVALYVERGETLRISGDNASPFSWEIEGNDLDKEWGQWRKQHMKDLSADDPAKTNALVAEFVNANPSSPLSTLMLLTSFSRREDEGLFRRLWLSLDGEARDSRWTSLAGRADQPDPFVKTPGKLKLMTVRSFQHGVDTLRTDSAKATLLFFWHSGFPARREHIDSIRAIAKEYPDSASRIIADICLEADSIAWRSPLRSDSLTKVVRAWAPAGLADSRLISLDVPRSPFYIVFSNDGNQRYRGSDPKEALSTFRTLMK